MWQAAKLRVGTDTQVTILDATTGDVLEEVHLRDAPVAAAVGRTMALISDKSGNVYALDISTVCRRTPNTDTRLRFLVHLSDLFPFL